MTLPSTKPLDGEFWYVLDDEQDIIWKPRPRIRGDFYLGWLGQNKTVVGAGLVRLAQGRITHICTHGTPYYWLQPYDILPSAGETLRAHNISGADTMVLDFSLAGWGLRDQTVPETRAWPDTSLSSDALTALLEQAVHIIVYSFRSEGEPNTRPAGGGLLARAMAEKTGDPQGELLDLLLMKYARCRGCIVWSRQICKSTVRRREYHILNFFTIVTVENGISRSVDIFIFIFL